MQFVLHICEGFDVDTSKLESMPVNELELMHGKLMHHLDSLSNWQHPSELRVPYRDLLSVPTLRLPSPPPVDTYCDRVIMRAQMLLVDAICSKIRHILELRRGIGFEFKKYSYFATVQALHTSDFNKMD